MVPAGLGPRGQHETARTIGADGFAAAVNRQIDHGVAHRPAAAVAADGGRFDLDQLVFRHDTTPKTVDRQDHRMIPIAAGQSNPVDGPARRGEGPPHYPKENRNAHQAA